MAFVRRVKRWPLYAVFAALLCAGLASVNHPITRLSGAPCDPETFHSAGAQALQMTTSTSQKSKQPSLHASTNDTGGWQSQHALTGIHLASVPRTVLPTIDIRMRVSVPLSIWQSLPRSNETSLPVSASFDSWTAQHPEWDHFLVDDAEMRSYITDHLEPALAELFWTMPSERMRADAFRYLILYQHGGVQADIDTLCLAPAAVWAPSGCLLAVAATTSGSLSPAVMGSVAGHGAMRAVVQLMWKRMGNVAALLAAGADLDKVAYNTTGAGVLTDGIAMFLAGGGEPVNVTELLSQATRLRGDGLCIVPAEDMHRFVTRAAAAPL